MVVETRNLTVRRGEVVGLAGLMVAGRTELAMSVFGRATDCDTPGRFLKNGQRDQPAPGASRRYDNGLAYVTEDRKQYGLLLNEDIRRNVTRRRWTSSSTGAGRSTTARGSRTPSAYRRP